MTKATSSLAVLIVAAFLVFLPPIAVAQFGEECGMDPNLFPPQNPNPVIHYGGRFITSTGTLRVLMIWVRFADDDESTPIWPDPDVLPQWAERFVDTAYSANGNYYDGAVSHYFYQNSYGKLHVIGDVYYVRTDNEEAYYHEIAYSYGAIAARSAIEMEVLDKLDDEYNVDFQTYDNWTYRAFNHSPNPDGKVDMIWFMTRNLHDGNYSDPRYQFGIGWAVLDCPPHVRDGVTIVGCDNCPLINNYPHSGIGMFGSHIYLPVNSSTATDGSYGLVHVIGHEMSHYLFGFGHFALHDYWGISTIRSNSNMQAYAGGWRSIYSGYEKWRLGWMAPTEVTTNTDNLTLRDLATTFDSTQARLVKVPLSVGTNQFILSRIEGSLVRLRLATPHTTVRRQPWCQAFWHTLLSRNPTSLPGLRFISSMLTGCFGGKLSIAVGTLAQNWTM